MSLDSDWTENVTLDDGTRAHIRPVRSSDAKSLRRGFDRLSPESVRRRFLEVKTRLTDDEVEQLTSVDFDAHVAVGVEVVRTLRHPDPIGIGRYIRTADAPGTAEIALRVLDDYQGHGVATIMLKKLVDLAREQGIERFVAWTLADNDAIAAVLAHSGLEIERKLDGGLFEYTLYL